MTNAAINDAATYRTQMIASFNDRAAYELAKKPRRHVHPEQARRHEGCR